MIEVRSDFEFLDGFAHQARLFHQASNTTTANRITPILVNHAVLAIPLKLIQ
ncbi:MAG: hypothetical protein RLZZ66_864 [Pseudomonadota bacterium]|jgi:hypothetical protein